MKRQSINQTVEELVTEHYAELYRFALFRLGDNDDAEDAVQELFLKMSVSCVDLDRIANRRSYLMRCMFNACIDRLKRRRAFAPLTEEMADDTPHPIADEERSRETERIRQFLSELPDEQAEVITMRIYDGLHFTEIAEILDIPATTVKSRFAYGIEKLRHRFQ